MLGIFRFCIMEAGFEQERGRENTCFPVEEGLGKPWVSQVVKFLPGAPYRTKFFIVTLRWPANKKLPSEEVCSPMHYLIKQLTLSVSDKHSLSVICIVSGEI